MIYIVFMVKFKRFLRNIWIVRKIRYFHWRYLGNYKNTYPAYCDSILKKKGNDYVTCMTAIRVKLRGWVSGDELKKGPHKALANSLWPAEELSGEEKEFRVRAGNEINEILKQYKLH